ncbi:DMT family transporter [Lentilactobacillus senioris]|uniref:DMT family transporter n=1 Tax=Lentilactobacillus senioris TaxID=931534 RepID=UPI003D27BBAD
MLTNKQKGIVLASSGGIFWGIQGPVSQYLFAQVNLSTEWLMGIKMLIAGIVILLYAKFFQHRSLTKIFETRSVRLTLLAYTVFGLAAVQYCYLLMVQASNAATATIMQSLGTIMIVIITIILYRQLPSRQEVIAVVVALLGTWLLVTKGDLGHLAMSPSALGLGLLLAFAGAMQTMIPVSLIGRYGTLVVTGWGMLLGGIIFSIINPVWVNTPPMTLGVVLGVGFIIIFGTILAYVCFTQSLQYVSPTVAGLLDVFEPLAATLGAVLFLNTTFNWAETLGAILTVSTVFILAIHKKSVPSEKL